MAGMYPADEILSIFGEQVQWPGLDPESGKFTNGSFTDPLVKPSFIPAETVNLILDNLAGLITALGGTPDNASTDQLKNAVIAKLAPLASMAWVKSTVWPIGTVYTQYPATDAAGNPVATGDVTVEFPASQAPAALFGGTWIACFENESVFFRSGGKTNLSTDGRSNGKQGDASRNLIGNIVGGSNGIAMVNADGTLTGSGALIISASLSSFYLNAGTWTGELRRIAINAASDPNFPTAGENRPVNRRIIIWKKTAMAV
jgi:hypothetical protein